LKTSSESTSKTASKTLVITGASKGIGRATALKFCDAGYRVINLSRSPAKDKRIENHRIDLAADNADHELKLILDEILEAGEIILVHNAATLINDSVLDMDTDNFRRTINLNVIAPHIVNQVVLNRMQPGSAVIYIGSTLSEKAVANSFSYVTSKHAVVGMMRASCQDLAGTGIHTTCICPGFTNTEMLRAHVSNDQEILDSLGGLSTFGRLITPEEIADTIFFVAEHPVLNGAVIHANLGQIES
jgi:NAD(P)-dependent dehydrogenase (short-subunit alcohol dehydrogenase family)